jgi:hypothetical protein
MTGCNGKNSLTITKSAEREEDLGKKPRTRPVNTNKFIIRNNESSKRKNCKTIPMKEPRTYTKTQEKTQENAE